MKIGVLAFQGAFIEHETALNKLGVKHVELREKSDFYTDYDGIILPGGESTVQAKILRDTDCLKILKNQIKNGLPVMGTCAGMILLAKNLVDDTPHLKTMDITVKRNAYGRQTGSFFIKNDFIGIGKIPMTFIRAPYIVSASDNVKILSTFNGKAVAAKQDNQLALAFHPELNESLKVHEYFINMIKSR